MIGRRGLMGRRGICGMGEKRGMREKIQRMDNRGQVTILAVLMLSVLIILFLTMIISEVQMGARLKANSATNLGVQSLFSHYSRPLMEQYEVFGGVIQDESQMTSLLYHYMKKNCNPKENSSAILFDPMNLRLKKLTIQQVKYLTDEDGKYFYDEVVSYMKLGMFTDNLSIHLPRMLEILEQEVAEEVSADLKKRQKEAAAIDGKILKLLSYVEGIKTNSTGISQWFGKYSGERFFVKSLACGGISQQAVGVSQEEIYEAVRPHYVDVMGELEGLYGAIGEIEYTYYDPPTKGTFDPSPLTSGVDSILSEFSNAGTMIDKSLRLLDEIEGDLGVLAGHLEESKALLEEHRGEMMEEWCESFSQEYEELSGYVTGEAIRLCNLQEVRQKLVSCKECLPGMEAAVSSIGDAASDIGSLGNAANAIAFAKATCASYPGASLVFSYEGYIRSNGEGMGVIEKIQTILEHNMVKLVLGEDAKISEKKLLVKDLTSMTMGISKKNTGIMDLSTLTPEGMYHEFLYNRYLSMYFTNYCNQKESGMLSYEFEYILVGNTKDEKNLQEVIKRLVNLRFLADYVYLITDVPRKKTCEEIATVCLGFTGVPAVIWLGKHLLMLAWSYGEGINDVKILMQGGKVDFAKSDATWKTTPQSLLEQKVEGSTDSDPTGLCYKDYLALLAFLMDPTTKIYRTMDMVESNLIATGHEHARCYRYLYGVSGSASYSYYRDQYEYVQEFDYCYE
ncbi:MAG: DUF5702 domain-containing protein [Lachnospiraceae bacterium]|nr:DUF5702 domain-containing protein [Lachnospiraceae bacterium]